MPRQAYMLVRRELIATWPQGPNTLKELSSLLGIPSNFRLLSSYDDFVNDGVRLRLESDVLPDTPEGAVLPEIEFIYQEGKPYLINILESVTVRKIKGQISLEAGS